MRSAVPLGSSMVVLAFAVSVTVSSGRSTVEVTCTVVMTSSHIVSGSSVVTVTIFSGASTVTVTTSSSVSFPGVSVGLLLMIVFAAASPLNESP
jgi:ABC-type tungstate transport system substrate-binding protein